jgi:hypothetical protein
MLQVLPSSTGEVAEQQPGHLPGLLDVGEVRGVGDHLEPAIAYGVPERRGEPPDDYGFGHRGGALRPDLGVTSVTCPTRLIHRMRQALPHDNICPTPPTGGKQIATRQIRIRRRSEDEPSLRKRTALVTTTSVNTASSLALIQARARTR